MQWRPKRSFEEGLLATIEWYTEWLVNNNETVIGSAHGAPSPFLK
jgi:dTDP-D-glucose 4,6-dehydratase